MRRAEGFTLIELLVAMIAGGMVMLSAFAFLRTVQVQSITTDRTSRFTAEFTAKLTLMQTELRSSPRIIAWDNSSIRYIDLPDEDTVTLALRPEGVYRNDTLLGFIAEGAGFDRFEITELPLGIPRDRLRVRLLDIHVAAHGWAPIRRDGMIRIAVPVR